MGPFYCPTDKKIYIDPEFFNELSQRFGAPGDFAMAYVIAHEVGHHVQNLEGTLDRAQQAQQSVGTAQGNQIQVGIELQADCYAGVWAANARDAQGSILEPGDVEEGMRAAEAIGDDTLQQQAQGTVVPESFTHGSSAQRMEALRRGMQQRQPLGLQLRALGYGREAELDLVAVGVADVEGQGVAERAGAVAFLDDLDIVVDQMAAHRLRIGGAEAQSDMIDIAAAGDFGPRPGTFVGANVRRGRSVPRRHAAGACHIAASHCRPMQPITSV